MTRPVRELNHPEPHTHRGTMKHFILTLILCAATLAAVATPAAATPTFDDISHSVHADDIRALAAAGITDGCGPNRFCPDDLVTRGQTAKFLVGAFDIAPSPAGDWFADDDRSIFEDHINALAAAEVTDGCKPRRAIAGTQPPAYLRGAYCPDENLTRGQMAKFLFEAADLPRAPAILRFDDVPFGHTFFWPIEGLANANPPVTRGCNPPLDTRFCPDRPITRAELATLLVRAADLQEV